MNAQHKRAALLGAAFAVAFFGLLLGFTKLGLRPDVSVGSDALTAALAALVFVALSVLLSLKR